MAFNRFRTVRQFLALSRAWTGLGVKSVDPTPGTPERGKPGSDATRGFPRNHAGNLWLDCDHDPIRVSCRTYRQIGGRVSMIEKSVCMRCGIPIERHLSAEDRQPDQAEN